MTSPYDTVPGKIFIGGIPPSTTQETLQRYFAQFGELSDCVLMQDKTTGKSRGFGFVTFRDGKSIEDVLKLQHVIDGKEMDCKKAIRREQQVQGDSAKEEPNPQTKKIFIGGLLQTTTEDELRAYFEQFGPLEDSVIMVDKVTGKSRGFGFVTFMNEDSVNLVIQQYYENKIGGKWVECKRAQPKETHRKGAHGHGNRDQSRFNKAQNAGGKESSQGGIVSSSQRYPRNNHNTQHNYGPSPSILSPNSFPEGAYSFQSGFPQNQTKNTFEPEYPQDGAFPMGTNFGGYPSQGFNTSSPYDKVGYPVYPQNAGLPGNYPGNYQPNYQNLSQGVYNPANNSFPQYPSSMSYQQGMNNSPPMGPTSTPIQTMSEALQGGLINPNLKLKQPYHQNGHATFGGEAGYGYNVQNTKLNPESLFEGKMNFMGFNSAPQMNFPPKEQQLSSEQFDHRGPQYGISAFPLAGVPENTFEQSSVGLIKGGGLRNPIVESQNVQPGVFNLENILQ